jgi:2-polyprenyl-6-methoxyphenol hydroxylase-like FAD-dependent oxidoreductase
MPDGGYYNGKTLARIEPHADGVTAVFDDGTRVGGDLLIAADGLHSAVRAQLFPQLAPHYAGYVARRGAVEADALSPALRELVLRRTVFGFPNGELMLSIPMPAPRAALANAPVILSGSAPLPRANSPRCPPTHQDAATACRSRRR